MNDQKRIDQIRSQLRSHRLPAAVMEMIDALEVTLEQSQTENRSLRQELEKQNDILRKQRIHLSASQATARTGSWELDLVAASINDNPLLWSDETYRIFGFEPGSVEISNELFFSLVSAEDRKRIEEAVDIAIRTKGKYDLVHRLRTIGGAEKVVHERGEIFYDEVTDIPVKMIGTVQDITERVKAERKLGEAYAELKTLFGNMQEMFFSIDLVHLRLIQMSDACERIYGRPVAEFSKNPNLWYELVHEQDRLVIDRNYAVMWEGKSFTQEYRIHHADGSIRWVETRIKPTLSSDGVLIRMDGITLDITDRKQMELALRNSEHWFRMLIDNSNEAYIVANENLEITFVSESLYRLVGYRPEDIMGMQTLSMAHPDHKERIDAFLESVLQQPGMPLRIVYQTQKKDGSYIWCERISTNLLHDPSIRGIVSNFRDVTEMVEAERMIRDSEHKFRSIIHNSSDVITVIGPEGDIVFASDSIARVTGYSVDETINSGGTSFVHPHDMEMINACFARVRNEPGRQETCTYRRRKKDGSYCWVEGTATNMLHDPAVSGIVINFRDITERKQYEEALKFSEHRFRTLIENSSEAIIVVDQELNITYVSDSLQRVAGYLPEDILGLPILSLAHPDEKDMITAFMNDVLANPGTPQKLIYKTRRKDGSYIWCERVTINLLHDPSITGIVSNFRDITERMEAEKALRDSEHKFRSLIQNSSDGIIVANEHGERVFVSDSIVRISGYTAAEMMGQASFSLAHPDYVEAAKAFMAEVLRHPGEPKTLVYKAAHKNGGFMWCERVTTNLLHDPAIRGIVSNLRDITDRKEQEEALKTSNEELRKSNAELDKFVYSVSHDLRAPLASILGLIELSRMETSIEDVFENLDKMKGSVNKLDGFIRDILDYSKNARLEIKSVQIDFRKLLGETMDNLRYMNWEGTGIDIRVSVDDPSPFYSDPHRLSVILNNLVANAIRYSNQAAAQPFVAVSVQTFPDKLELAVEDNGIGISPEHHEKIFQMFFRASNTSVGSGLGLYIVHETMKKLQGTILLESTPGSGSRFLLTIPNHLETAN